MSTNPQSSENDILEFNEKIDLLRAKFVLSLNFNDFKSTFWKKKEILECGHKWKLDIYHKAVCKYLKIMIFNKGVMQRKYKYGKQLTGGRMYVDGFGVQSLQHRLRNFLIEPIYIDVDIENCHPCICYDLCKKYNISCPLLEAYVKNRSEILSTYEITKLDIIIALNTDKNKNKNKWIKMLHEELIKIKTIINERNTNIIDTTDNENNPISSIFNRILSFYENKIIQSVIKDHVDFVGVPMFDGFLIEKDHKINLDDYKKDSIKFIEKSVITNIDISEFNEEVVDPLSYEAVKIKFEMKNFQIKNPLIYMSLVKDQYGESDYQMYKKNEIIDLVQSYQFKKKSDDEDDDTRCIFNKWLADDNRRSYETFAFIPYSKTKPIFNENEIYNTFKPFKSKYIELCDDKIDTSNFYDLLNELCGGNDKVATDYLLKYIAHMFQFPEIRPDVVIIMMGTTGVGKDKLITLLIKLMGFEKYAYQTARMIDVFGEFNDCIYNTIILQFNEVEGRVALEHHEQLKDKCTANTNNINPKGKTRFMQANVLRIFVVSNNKTPYNVQHNDRRGFIIKSTDKLQEDRTFFGKITKDMNNPDYLNTLFTELMNIDLTEFDVKDRPKTDIFEKMRYDGISPIYFFMKEFMNEKLYTKKMYVRKNRPDNEVTVSCSDFYILFSRYLNRNNLDEHLKFLKTKTVKKDLDTIKGIVADHPVKINGKTVRCHIFDIDIVMGYLKKNYFSSEKLEEIIDYGSDVEQNNSDNSDYDSE